MMFIEANEKKIMDSIWDACKKKTNTLRQQYQMAMFEYSKQKKEIPKIEDDQNNERLVKLQSEAKKYAENAGGVEFGAIYTAYINGAQSKFKKP